MPPAKRAAPAVEEPTADGKPPPGLRQRIHRGRTIEERRAERRTALMDAALELFGTKGYAATSITEICKTSYVTNRYFYEEFGDREHLLLALYEREMAKVSERVAAISVPPGPDHVREATRQRIGAFVHSVIDDERIARVALLESASPALEARRRDAHAFFAQYIASLAFPYVAKGEIQPYDFDLLALCFVGAVNEVMSSWILTPPEARKDVDRLIDTLVELYLMVRAGLER